MDIPIDGTPLDCYRQPVVPIVTTIHNQSSITLPERVSNNKKSRWRAGTNGIRKHRDGNAASGSAP